MSTDTVTDGTASTSTGVSGLIDVHTHFPASAHRAALERSAGPKNEGITLPVWNSEKTLDILGNVGIDYSVLSPTSPSPKFTDADDARRTAREFNEELADQIAEQPGTYGGVAFLPLPFVDESLEELAYALDVLKLDGAHLFTNYQGQYPGDEQFEPLLAELNRRRTTVMTHPTAPRNVEQMLVGGLLPVTLEFMFETTRLASNLLYNGALERYPDISWILAHGGATILQTSNRLCNTIHIMKEETNVEFGGLPESDDKGRELMRNFYVDVVWNVREPMLGALATLQGPDKLLFGTDMPFEHGPWIANGINDFRDNSVVTDDVKKAVARDNALRLFPTVAAKLEKVPVQG